MAKLKYFVETVGNIQTVVVQNGAHKRALFRTDDDTLLKDKMKEISLKLKKAEYVDVMISLYRYARDHGCTVQLSHQPVLTQNNLVIRRVDHNESHLVLKKGKDEILLMKDNLDRVRAKYVTYMNRQRIDQSFFTMVWEYAMAKAKI